MIGLKFFTSIILSFTLLHDGAAAVSPSVETALHSAKVALERGDNRGALAVLEPAWQALAAEQAVPADDRLRLADALVSRLVDAQRFVDADRLAQQAQPFVAQARDTRVAAEALAVFAVPAIRLGHGAAAEKMLLSAEMMRRGIAGDTRSLQLSIAQRRVVVLAGQGRMAEALVLLEPLVDVALASDFPDPVRGLVIPQTFGGLLIYQGRFADAATVLERMRERALALWTSPRQRAEFLETLGEALRGSNQLVRARDTYLAGLAELAGGKAGITTTEATLNANIARVSLLLGDKVEAVARADRAAALMRDRGNEARDDKGELSALDQRMLQGTIAIALDIRHAARTPGADDPIALALMQEALQLQQPRAATDGIASLADVRKALRPDELFLQILQGTDAIHVMAVTSTGIAWHRHEQSSNETCPRFARLRAGLTPAQPLRCQEGEPEAAAAAGFDLAEAHRLWADLLAPLGPAMTGQPHWIVATAGTPASVPLGVLLIERPVDAGFAAQPWLGARRALSYLPSGAELIRLRSLPKPKSARRLVAVGAPCIGDLAGAACIATVQHPASLASSFSALDAGFRLIRAGGYGEIMADRASILKLPALPSAPAELRGLASQFRGRADLAMGAAATEAYVRRMAIPPGAVVAFATHGLAADGLGLAEPALVLTPGVDGPDDDGLLLASDVAKLKLSDNFVILSACNMAGVRNIERLDAYQGFARAFFAAGARALLISQFEVLDGGAARLTNGMLAAWRKDGTGRADALRASIRAMLADLNAPQLHHPRAWASMILVGTPN